MNDMRTLNIFWDVDGTLFDTYPAMTFAMSKALNEMGYSVALNVIDGLARQSLERCLETLSQRFKLDPDLLQARFAESYRTVDPANQPAFPGVRAVCEMIHARGGMNVIITHRALESTRRRLEIHGMSSDFDDIFSVEQGHARKPDPAMALAALEKYALFPAETLMVGDREIDIQSGRAAGLRACLFGQTQLSAPADIQIKDYDDLIKILAEEILST